MTKLYRKYFLIFVFVQLLTTAKAQISKPDSIKYLVEAQIYYNQTQKAENTIQQYPKRNTTFYFLKGKIFFAQGNFIKAKANFMRAESAKKNTALYQISACFAQLSDFKNAAIFLEKYLYSRNKMLISEVKTDTLFKDFRKSKAWALLFKQDFYSQYELELNDANVSFKNQKYDLAYDILDKLILKKKNKVDAYLLRFKIHMDRNYLKAARQDIEKVIELKSRKQDYKLMLAQVLFKQKKYRKAEKVLSKIAASKQRVSCQFYFLVAKNAFQLKKYSKAIRNIDIYLQFYYNDFKALFLKAEILTHQEDFYASLPLYGKCIKNEPSAKLLNARANAYYQCNTFIYAEKDLLLSLDYEPNNRDTYYQKGFVRLALGDIAGAKSDWEKAQKLGLYKAADAIEKYCKKM